MPAGEQPRKGSGGSQTSHEEDGPAHGEPPAIVATVFRSLPRALLSRTPYLLAPSQPCPALSVAVLLPGGLHFDGHPHVAALISSYCTSAAQRRVPQRRSQTTGPPDGTSRLTRLAFTFQFIRPPVSTHSHGDSLSILVRQPASNVPTQR